MERRLMLISSQIQLSLQHKQYICTNKSIKNIKIYIVVPHTSTIRHWKVTLHWHQHELILPLLESHATQLTKAVWNVCAWQCLAPSQHILRAELSIISGTMWQPQENPAYMSTDVPASFIVTRCLFERDQNIPLLFLQTSTTQQRDVTHGRPPLTTSYMTRPAWEATTHSVFLISGWKLSGKQPTGTDSQSKTYKQHRQ